MFPYKVNVRIIAATNRDLNKMIEEKTFRAAHLCQLFVDLNKPFKEMLAKQERDYIQAALKKHDGNIDKTAESLGIHRATLYRKII